MNPTADIKKGNGIEDLFRGFAAGKPEEVKEVEVAEGRFQMLLEKYRSILDVECDPLEALFWTELNKITDTLTPTDINKFLQTTIQHEQHKEYHWRTGRLILRLIQNSYNAGHNDFAFDTTALEEIGDFGSYLEGTEERPMEIAIKGNIGDWCGWKARHLTFNIQGSTGDWCGRESISSVFNIQGDAGRNCGKYSLGSTFNITGSIGYNCGDQAHRLTFKTPNKETLREMLRRIPTGNKIIFIRKNGKEKVMRDYANNS